MVVSMDDRLKDLTGASAQTPRAATISRQYSY
jgi:hypothetical protein